MSEKAPKRGILSSLMGLFGDDAQAEAEEQRAGAAAERAAEAEAQAADARETDADETDGPDATSHGGNVVRESYEPGWYAVSTARTSRPTFVSEPWGGIPATPSAEPVGEPTAPYAEPSSPHVEPVAPWVDPAARHAEPVAPWVDPAPLHAEPATRARPPGTGSAARRGALAAVAALAGGRLAGPGGRDAGHPAERGTARRGSRRARAHLHGAVRAERPDGRDRP